MHACTPCLLLTLLLLLLMLRHPRACMPVKFGCMCVLCVCLGAWRFLFAWHILPKYLVLGCTCPCISSPSHMHVCVRRMTQCLVVGPSSYCSGQAEVQADAALSVALFSAALTMYCVCVCVNICVCATAFKDLQGLDASRSRGACATCTCLEAAAGSAAHALACNMLDAQQRWLTTVVQMPDG